MALNKGIWDPKLRGTSIKGTNLKSLNLGYTGIGIRFYMGLYRVDIPMGFL